MIMCWVEGVAVITRHSLTEHEPPRAQMPHPCVLIPRLISVVQTQAAALRLEDETESFR